MADISAASVSVVSARRNPQASVPSVRGLLLRFGLAATIALGLVVIVTAALSRRTGLREAEGEARRLTWIIGNGVVEPAVTPELLVGDAGALDRFDAIVRKSIIRGSLTRVKIWDSNGRIVYSDEPRLIGSTYPLGPDELNALTTRRATAELSDLSEPENRFESPSIKLLEVYTGITGPDKQPLLFETYFAHDMVLESGRQAWRRYAPVSFAALGLLQLAQIPIVLQLLRRLRSGQQARETLLRRSVHASSAERRRIASDLHDGVVQDLTGVSYTLAAVGRDRSLAENHADAVTSAAAVVRNSVHGLRSLLVDIYPPNLEAEGLESALSELVQRLSTHGLAATLTVDLPSRALPHDTTTLLYRAALEATRNVTQHARASKVAIDVDTVDDQVVLSVEDDGTGFDPTSLLQPRNDGHVGMQVLGDIASDFGGAVYVESKPGHGTKVMLRMPLS